MTNRQRSSTVERSPRSKAALFSGATGRGGSGSRALSENVPSVRAATRSRRPRSTSVPDGLRTLAFPEYASTTVCRSPSSTPTATRLSPSTRVSAASVVTVDGEVEV